MLATLFSQEGTKLQGFNLRQMDTGMSYSSSLSHTHTQTMIKLIQKLKLAGQIYEMLPVKVCSAPFRKFKMNCVIVTCTFC